MFENAMRGRPPKPTILHLIQGTDRVHRMRKRQGEPMVDAVIGAPPAGLSRIEKAIWREVAALAHAWLRAPDRMALETFVRLKALERQDLAGMTGAQLLALNKLGGLLGLNPAERARINVPAPSQEEDPNDVFFRPHVVLAIWILMVHRQVPRG
jgi:phage terminase small subunit